MKPHPAQNDRHGERRPSTTVFAIPRESLFLELLISFNAVVIIGIHLVKTLVVKSISFFVQIK